MTKTTKIIPTILLSAILIGVVFTFNTPLNEAQAVHPDKDGNPITICLATNPHLNMKPATDMQPDPLFTGIPPTDFMVTWTFNRPIADSLAVHGLGFLTLTGPGLSIQPTSFGPVTNGDLTVKINFDGNVVAAALEQHLNNLNVNEADVALNLFANYGAQPHLFDDTNNQASPGIICATSVDGSDTIKVQLRLRPEIEKELISGPPEIGIYEPIATEYVYTIEYTGPAALVTDIVPAEFDVTGIQSSAGAFTETKAGKGKNTQSNTTIEWNVPAGVNTLTVTIETVQNPGKGHKNPVFKPTTCETLTINVGATAFEVDQNGNTVLVSYTDPDTGEVTLHPVVIIGPSNSLEVEAVEGAKPCSEG